MDLTALAGMVFVLLLTAIIGGFILLLPIARRLGLLLEQHLQEKGTSASARDLAQLHAAVDGLRAEVDKLVERQAFTELLLEERATLELPSESRGG